MALATILALTGNIQVGLLGHTGSPFAWLEAMAPPVIVLSTAYVLKEQILEAIEHRHTTERTYQTALNEWHKATAHPEDHPQWSQLYANALRDALSRANNRRQETLAALTTADWRALVYRELQTEHWYTDHEVDSSRVAASSGDRNHPFSGAGQTQRKRRPRQRRCVVCGTELPEPSPLGGRKRRYCSNRCRQRAKWDRWRRQ